MFSPSDESLLGAIFHGHAQSLDQAGLQPEWVEDGLVKEVVRAALNVSRSGQPVNLMNVMSQARNIQGEAWRPIMEISLNGYGNVEWKSALKASRAAYLLRQFGFVMAEARKKYSVRPSDIEDWLPGVITTLDQLNATGIVYDARPSTIYLEDVPEVKFQSRMPEVNEMLRGGYRALLLIYAGVTGQGKSTMAYSHLVDILGQGKTGVLVDTENSRRKALNRILLGMTRLTEQEVAARKGRNEERHDILQQTLVYLDDHLRVFEITSYTDSRLENILRWEKPDVMCVDYLRDVPGMMTRFTSYKTRSDKVDSIGDMAYRMFEIANKYNVAIITGGQMSDENAQKFMRYDHHRVGTIYGSARPFHAADLVYGLKRFGGEANVGYFRNWKNRFDGIQDREYHLDFIPERKIFARQETQ